MRIAIVGGGFSGTIACLQLLRTNDPELRITLVERHPAQLNRGLAYSAGLSQQLLNVPAARMGLFPDATEGFWEWATREPLPGVAKDAFLPRHCFGDFVQRQFGEAMVRHAGRITVRDQEAVDLEPTTGGHRLLLADGTVVEAEAVLLALGNAPSGPVPNMSVAAGRHKGYIHSPWKPGVLDTIGKRDHVLFLGTGLTMVDLLLSLMDQGHQGPVTLVSRRGLLPCSHAPATPWRWTDPAPDMQHAEPVDLLCWLRTEAGYAQVQGVAWTNVIDAARPLVRSWWQALSTEKRRSFLRHLRPFWEVHRHRMPAEVHGRVLELLRSGRVRLIAARVREVRSGKGSLHVALDHRQGSTENLAVHHLINCTGPDPDVRRTGQRLLAALLDKDLIGRDELGLQCTPDGAAVDPSGRVSERLFLLGPMCKAALWECTAVPEIRDQVAQLVRRFTSVPLLPD